MKPIPGSPGYFISKKGKVFSDRQQGGGGGRKAKLHAVKDTDKGHKYHRVVIMQNGKKTTKYVHDLVHAAHGKGKKKDGQQIRHLDGNKHNNSSGNLKPGSASENNLEKKSLTKSLMKLRFHITVWED